MRSALSPIRPAEAGRAVPVPAVGVSAFRAAMGEFPTGVTVVTVASGHGTMHGTSIGSSDTDEKELTVVPCMLPWPAATVTTVTPVGNSPIASRKALTPTAEAGTAEAGTAEAGTAEAGTAGAGTAHPASAGRIGLATDLITRPPVRGRPRPAW